MSPDTIKAVFVQSLFQPWVAFLIIIPAVFGLGLWLMGTFFAFVVALGDQSLGYRRWAWAAAIAITGPLAAVPFACIHHDAAYVRGVMAKGALLLMPAIIYYGYRLLTLING